MATRKAKKKEKVIKKEVVELTSIHVLNLNGLETISKLLILRLLLVQDYLLVSGRDRIIINDPMGLDGDRTNVNYAYLTGIEYLRFDHERKLMYVTNAEEAQKSMAISCVTMTVSTDLDFTKPDAHHPETMKIGTALYLRVQ